MYADMVLSNFQKHDMFIVAKYRRSRPRDPDAAAPNARALGPEGYDPLWLQRRRVEAAVKPPIKDIFDSWAAKTASMKIYLFGMLKNPCQ